MNLRWICFFLVAFLAGCDSEEAVDPVVVTNSPQALGQTSVIVGATIKEAGSIRPIQYGLLWSDAGGINILTAKKKYDLGSTSSTITYSIQIDSLSPGTNYYVRSYTASPDYSKIYYGNEVAFKTLP